MNGIYFILRGGIAWLLIPKNLLPCSTTFRYFVRWRNEGLFIRINHDLVIADRERGSSEALPTATA
jgi:putative transposase